MGASGCRRRHNGSMPAAPGRPRSFTSATQRRPRASMDGGVAMWGGGLILWGAGSPIPGACTTGRAICESNTAGSGKQALWAGGKATVAHGRGEGEGSSRNHVPSHARSSHERPQIEWCLVLSVSQANKRSEGIDAHGSGLAHNATHWSELCQSVSVLPSRRE